MKTSRASGISSSANPDCFDIFKACLRYTTAQICISEVTACGRLFHTLQPFFSLRRFTVTFDKTAVKGLSQPDLSKTIVFHVSFSTTVSQRKLKT